MSRVQPVRVGGVLGAQQQYRDANQTAAPWLSQSTTPRIYFYGSDGDVLAPGVTVGTPTRTKISRVADGSGVDATTFTLTVDEDFQAYQLRVVPDTASIVTDGTQLESGGGGTMGVAVEVTVTDDELVAAGAVEGVNIVKAFAQDLAGNWSA